MGKWISTTTSVIYWIGNSFYRRDLIILIGRIVPLQIQRCMTVVLIDDAYICYILTIARPVSLFSFLFCLFLFLLSQHPERTKRRKVKNQKEEEKAKKRYTLWKGSSEKAEKQNH